MRRRSIACWRLADRSSRVRVGRQFGDVDVVDDHVGGLSGEGGGDLAVKVVAVSEGAAPAVFLGVPELVVGGTPGFEGGGDDAGCGVGSPCDRGGGESGG